MGTSLADWITAGGTAGAAIAAAIAAWKASQSTSASVDLVRIERERLDEERLQRAVAELRVDLKPLPSISWRISVVNGGPAAARDVEVFVHKPDDDLAPYSGLRRHADAVQHRDWLAPGEDISVDTVSHGLDARPHAGVSLEWTDSRGRQERSTVLAEPPPDQ